MQSTALGGVLRQANRGLDMYYDACGGRLGEHFQILPCQAGHMVPLASKRRTGLDVWTAVPRFQRTQVLPCLEGGGSSLPWGSTIEHFISVHRISFISSQLTVPSLVVDVHHDGGVGRGLGAVRDCGIVRVALVLPNDHILILDGEDRAQHLSGEESTEEGSK